MSRFTVIGGANIDITGASQGPLRGQDSNPGRVTLSFGGVGRNIAENCCRLGQSVRLATVIGSDPLGTLLWQDCLNCGIDMSCSYQLEGQSSSVFLAVLDAGHDLNCAVADMSILNQLTAAHLQPALTGLQTDDWLIFDTNLSAELMQQIAQNAGCRLALDPLSAAKTEKVRPILPYLHLFKPNRKEAEVLCGFSVDEDAAVLKALDWMRMQGVQEIVLSLGEKGTALAWDDQRVRIRHAPITPVNTTGAGDSFLAAYLCLRDQCYPPEEAACLACGAALLTLQSEKAVASELTVDRLFQIQKTLQFEITSLK